MLNLRITASLPLLFVMSCGRCDDDGVVDDSGAHSESDSLLEDADQDGYPVGQDCDDEEPLINPGADEICDGKDNDCNALVDDVALQDDLCDGIDNDCDGMVDEDEVAIFESDDGSVIDFSENLLGATEGAPMELRISDPGELRICGGDRRFLLMDISSSVTVRSANPSLNVEISGGESMMTVIEILGDPTVEVTLEDLTIRDGMGSCWSPQLARNAGGGICCIGESVVRLVDVVLRDNSGGDSGRIGGGMFVQGCAVAMERSLVTENEAIDGGGGVFLYGGTLSITDSSFIDNESSAGGSGVGLYSSYDGTADVPAIAVMENSVIKGGSSGTAVMVGPYSSFDCAGSTSGEYGVIQNSADTGVVFMLYDSYGFTGTNCDMGSAADGNDNSGPDVYGDDDVAWTADIGNDATFFCSIEQDGCTIE